MKNKFLAFLLSLIAIFSCTASAYAAPDATQMLANGTGTIVKIGVVILVVLIVGVTGIFAYGMYINRGKDDDEE